LFVPAQYPTIQAAIDAAYDGDTVIVADGTYTGTGNRDIDFLGKAITVRSESGPENCVIDCENEGYGFYFHSGEGENSILDGFTITNGYWAIWCDYSSPLIRDCNITNSESRAPYGGRGITCYQSSPTISNCTITGNTADHIGGGIYCAAGSPTIADCTISENTAERGGGIYCWDSSPTITNCAITDNYAYDDGGGIYCRDSSPTITNCIIEDNTADFSGAGIYGCDGTIANCVISDNVGSAYPVTLPAASKGGGLAYCDGSIVNCTITGNSTEIGGGLASCNGRIINCVIAGNFSEHSGGGLNNCYGSIINCTVVDNKTDGTGGGLEYYFTRPGSITNCIVWGNIAERYPQLYSTIPSYSCVQDWTGGGVGNIDADPCFAEAGAWYWDDNGTPDYRRDDFWVWVDGDYRLWEDSPCIDAGDPNYVAGANETDLDGKPRVIGGRIDMGAYEYRPPVQAEMKLRPQSLNCVSKRKYIKAHITLPEGIWAEDVDVNEPALAEPVAVESEYVRILGNGDSPVKVEIGFDRQEFCDCVAETGQIEVTVSGYLTSGQPFIATDTVKIGSRGRR
jgi:parallel beta-helix repeat protein